MHIATENSAYFCDGDSIDSNPDECQEFQQGKSWHFYCWGQNILEELDQSVDALAHCQVISSHVTDYKINLSLFHTRKEKL